MRYITLVFLCLLLAAPAFAAKTKPSPVLEDGALLAWATGTATQSLTFSYSDYKKVFGAEERNFTPAGWKEFQAAQARILKDVINYRGQVSAQTAKAPDAPFIKSKGQKGGVYEWIVSIPVTQTGLMKNKKSQRKISLTMTIGIVKNYPSVAGQSGLRVLRWSEPVYATKKPVKKKQPAPSPTAIPAPTPVPAIPLSAPVAPPKQ